MTDVEKFFQGLKEMSDEATPENKERGKRIAQNWVKSRQSKDMRKKNG